jgi:hypothetical protein
MHCRCSSRARNNTSNGCWTVVNFNEWDMPTFLHSHITQFLAQSIALLQPLCLTCECGACIERDGWHPRHDLKQNLLEKEGGGRQEGEGCV